MKKTSFYFALLSFFLVSSPVAAKKQKSYGDFTDVQFVRNYDGDTITVDIKDQHPLIGENIPIRVAGIDTPEIKGKCAQEKELAHEAKEVVYELFQHGRKVKLKNLRRGKYFRIIADVYVGRRNLANVLIKKGLAVRYDGGTKGYDWCSSKAKTGGGWGDILDKVLN
ncbi:thermonuclease family protein [Desulfobulbus sp. TB]|nr:thermonuclease family protein [Desulfobulbus sp. TB]